MLRAGSRLFETGVDPVFEQRDRRQARRARQIQRASTWSRPAITSDHFHFVSSSSFPPRGLAQPNSSRFTTSSHHAQSVGCLAHPGMHDTIMICKHGAGPAPAPEAPPAPNVPQAAKARAVPCAFMFQAIISRRQAWKKGSSVLRFQSSQTRRNQNHLCFLNME